MADDLGSASVTITPDLAKFAADLRAGLAATDAGKVDVGLDVDEAKLEEFKARVSSYNAVIGVGIRVDDAKLAEVQARLDAFGLEHKSATVDVDTKDVGPKLEDLTKKADAAGGSLRNMGKDAQSASGGMGALITTALTIGPALVPIAGVITGAAIGLTGALSAATVGLGAFAIAAEGYLPLVTDQVKQVITSFQGLTAPAVLPAVQGAVALLGPTLNAFVPIVASVSKALVDLEGSARRSLGGDTFTGFVQFIQANAGPAILAFGHFFGGLGVAIANALETAQPLITQMDNALFNLGNEFAKWGNAAGSPNSGFTNFITTIQSEMPLVESTLKNLVGILSSLTGGANALGIGLLSVINPLLTVVNLMLKFGGPELSAGVLAIVGLGVAFAKLSGPVKDATKFLLEFRAALAATEIVEGATAVAGVGTAAEGAAVGVAGAATEAGGLAEGLAGAVTAAGGLGVVLGGLGVGALAATVAIAALHFKNDDLTAAEEKLTHGVENLSTNTLPNSEKALRAQIAVHNELKPKIDATAAATKANNDAVAQAGGLMPGYTNQMTGLQGAYQKINETIPVTSAKLKEQQEALDKTAVKMGTTGTAIQAAATATGQSTTQVTTGLEKQSHAIGVSTDALLAMETQSKETGAALVRDFNSAVTTTTTNLNSFTDAISHFSGQADVASGDITAFFAQAGLATANFQAESIQALSRGLDPAFVVQLMEQGPQKAEPILRGILSDSSGTTIAMVNAAQVGLKQQSDNAVLLLKLSEQAAKEPAANLAGLVPLEFALKTVEAKGATAEMLQQVANQFTGGSLTDLERYADAWADYTPQKILSQAPAAGAAAGAQGTAVTGALNAATPGVQGAADRIAAITPKSLNAVIPGSFAAGVNTGGQYASGIGQTTATAKAVVDAHASEVIKPLDKGPPAKTAGSNTGAAWAAGITTSGPAATAAANGVVTAATNEFNAHQDRARGFGQATATAFVQGITSQQGAAVGAVEAMTVTALAPMNAHQNLAGVYGGNEVGGFVRGIQAQQGSGTAAVDAFTVAAIGPFNAHQNLASTYGGNEARAFIRGITSTGTGGVDGWVIAAIGPMNAHQNLASTYGSNTAAGFVRGIQSQAGAAAAAAGNVAQSAINNLRAVPAILSPSKVTTEVGKFFGQGFTLGITGTVPAASAAAGNLSAAALRALQLEAFIYNEQRMIAAYQSQAASGTTIDPGLIPGLQHNIALTEAQAAVLRRQALAGQVAPIPLGRPIAPVGGRQVTDVPGTEAAAGLNFSPTYQITIHTPGGKDASAALAAEMQQLLADHDQLLLNELAAVGARS